MHSLKGYRSPACHSLATSSTMPNSSTMSASPRETPDRYHLSHPGLPGSTSCLPWAPEPRTTPCACSELSETSRTEPRPAGGQQARGAGSVTHTAQAGVHRGRPWAHPRDAVRGSEKGRTLATTVTPATLVTATRTERPHPCHPPVPRGRRLSPPPPRARGAPSTPRPGRGRPLVCGTAHPSVPVPEGPRQRPHLSIDFNHRPWDSEEARGGSCVPNAPSAPCGE